MVYFRENVVGENIYKSSFECPNMGGSELK